ncbi:MAG TPA: glycoside hydrolase family 15 protein [Egibacteraceae bacterium]|nr:glycoside hydrolase family 15 protein [Egibacteraceae bacterium]
MSQRLEDYAFVGDTETVALVCRSGSVDWLCLPRFDSGACFAALLGDRSHGRWLLAPAGRVRAVRRRYRPGTLVLETEFDADGGTVRIVDAMPPRDLQRGAQHDLVRVVEGVRGRVAMRMELVVRFDYGWVVPWVQRQDGRLGFVAGPDALVLATPVQTRGKDQTTVAEFAVGEGDRVPFVLAWHPSHEPAAEPVDAETAVDATTDWWQQWSQQLRYDGEWKQAVDRSLITLKALTYSPTGGIVAAPTTSLPERLGGVRNWDYRYVWLRDATFTLLALLLGGCRREAVAWRDWLLRAVAGDPARLQILYGPAGERRLTELELPWLPGYEASAPVRIGNDACAQVQLDVYGEVMDAMHATRRGGIEPDEAAWALQRALLEFLESNWQVPDHGLWEVRGPRRQFTHSKVMSWVAFDRAVKAVEQSGLDGPVQRWRRQRDDVRADVLANGFDPDRNTFTRAYGSPEVDASLLLIPRVGFLPPQDERVVGTVEAVLRELSGDETLVWRYRSDIEQADGLPPGEGAFLMCSFWLVDALALIGRLPAARERYERLLALRNDVGLLAEEYDPVAGRLLGNFPQAFSHIGVVNSACNLSAPAGPVHARGHPADDAPGRG